MGENGEEEYEKRERKIEQVLEEERDTRRVEER